MKQMTKDPAFAFWRITVVSLFMILIQKKIYPIDNEVIVFVNKYGYALIDNPDHPDIIITYHLYFLIYDDLFDRILGMYQKQFIVLKVISKNVSLMSVNYSSTYLRSKLRKRSNFFSPHHQLHILQQKTVHDYSKKFVDDFKLIVVYLPPKLTNQN